MCKYLRHISKQTVSTLLSLFGQRRIFKDRCRWQLACTQRIITDNLRSFDKERRKRIVRLSKRKMVSYHTLLLTLSILICSTQCQVEEEDVLKKIERKLEQLQDAVDKSLSGKDYKLELFWIFRSYRNIPKMLSWPFQNDAWLVLGSQYFHINPGYQ